MFIPSGNFAKGVKIALMLGTIFLSAAENSDASAARNLRVSYSAPATAFLPLWAAKDAGFFNEIILVSNCFMSVLVDLFGGSAQR